MNEEIKLRAVLDANVLYPAPLRDFLLRLAQLELFEPIWTKQIHLEWVNNLLKKRKDIDSNRVQRTVFLMNKSFPKANIKVGKELIESIELPDKDDRHVLGAGIKSNSKFIITNNLKDFPKKYLRSFHIEAIDPDQFVVKLIKIDADKVQKAFENQLHSLKNPPLKRDDLIGILVKNGLKMSMQKLTE